MDPALLIKQEEDMFDVSHAPASLTPDATALRPDGERVRPWGALALGRRARESRLRIPPESQVTFPSGRVQPIKVNEVALEVLRNTITAKFSRFDVEETVWLEQLSCLLDIADYRKWKTDGRPIVGNAKVRTTDWRRELARTCWAFSQKYSGDFEALAKEIISLTVEACGIMHDGHPGFIHAQNAILREISTFEQATAALNKSGKMTIHGVSLYSFIPKSDDSSSRAVGSEVRNDI